MSTSRQFNTPISLSSAALTATHNSNTIGNLFTTGGNVGIGTTSPIYTLDINGTLEASNSNGLMLFASSGNVFIGTTTPTGSAFGNGNLYMYGANGSNNGIAINGVGNSTLQFWNSGTLKGAVVSVATAGNWSTDSRVGDMVIRCASNQSMLFNSNGGSGVSSMIISGGNVGIGTSVPAYSLQVDGDVALNVLPGIGTTGSIKIGRQDFNARWHMINVNTGTAASLSNMIFNLHDAVTSTSIAPILTLRGNGNVGIGTTSPTTALYVSGSGTSITSGITFVKSSGAYSGTTYENGVGARWYSGSENNTSTPTYIIYNNNNAGAYIAWGGTSWTSNSDRSLKTDFEDILNPLDKISQIKGTYYKFKTDSEDTLRRLGVIAQDVQAVLPEIVTQNAEGKLGVNYTELIPLLIESIKELNSENELLKQDITNIKTQLGL